MAAMMIRNLADEGSISVSSSYASAPGSRLQNQHTTRRWKGRNGAAEFILVTWPTAQSLDYIGLERCAVVESGVLRAMSTAATTRVRVSSVDLTGEAGDVWDSTIAAGRVRAEYARLALLRPAPISGKSVLIELSESGVDAVLAGRLVIGLVSRFTINFSHGWGDGYEDLSRIKTTYAGLDFIERDERRRVLNIPFESLVETDRNAIVREVGRLNGQSSDVLFVIDENSAQLDRDSVWGRIVDANPPRQPNPAYFAWQFELKERM